MNIVLICIAIISFHLRAAWSIDVETFDLKCPGDCPASLPTCLFYVHPIINSKFYMCIDDQAKLLTCPEGSIFYPEKEQCDLPAAAVNSSVSQSKNRAAKNTIRRAFITRQQLLEWIANINTRIQELETHSFGAAKPSILTSEATAKANQQQLTTVSKPTIANSGKQESKKDNKDAKATTPGREAGAALKPEAKLGAGNRPLMRTTPAPSTTQSSKLNDRLQLSNQVFQIPVNDFHSNFGMNSNRFGNNKKQRENSHDNANHNDGSVVV